MYCRLTGVCGRDNESVAIGAGFNGHFHAIHGFKGICVNNRLGGSMAVHPAVFHHDQMIAVSGGKKGIMEGEEGEETLGYGQGPDLIQQKVLILEIQMVNGQ
ncbi:hypothetical protein DSCOOX_35210 [Desulfosarcina ovata subsp. ovata]|uniref:Uncharacterized protein n=1 Tax=Desulfosarcina ovata subsp. ovata TaxID=2752305 RepID=A0A5K8ACR3_9BACT|nr:hypothetical protein DSCOOX_35210 [Desulfosarcina ovata subsp. ovata]